MYNHLHQLIQSHNLNQDQVDTFYQIHNHLNQIPLQYLVPVIMLNPLYHYHNQDQDQLDTLNHQDQVQLSHHHIPYHHHSLLNHNNNIQLFHLPTIILYHLYQILVAIIQLQINHVHNLNHLHHRIPFHHQLQQQLQLCQQKNLFQSMPPHLTTTTPFQA